MPRQATVPCLFSWEGLKMKQTRTVWVRIVVALLVLVLFVYAACYLYAQSLCRRISRGEEIHTVVGNLTTAPMWTDDILTILQCDGVKIPLVEACYYRNIQAVSELLENGADPNFYIDGRWTPIEAALVNGPAGPIDENSLRILEMLIDAGADVNLHASATPAIDQMASLMQPDSDIRASIFLLLLNHGAVGNASESEHLLHDVIRSGNVELTQTMISDYGFNVNSVGYQGQTPLILAVYYGQYNDGESATEDMITMLLACGADKDTVDDFGKSAFDYATAYGYDDIADYLK